MRGRLLNMPADRPRRRLRPGRRRDRRRRAAFRTSAPRVQGPHVSPAAASDPLTDELQRCQALATQAKDDAACEAAWAESRRRFFTYPPPPSAATPPAASPKSSDR